MNLFFKSLWSLFTVTILALNGCEVYNAPPEPRIVFPDGGAYTEDEEIVIEFTEEILPETLRIVLWNVERTIENEIPSDAKPLIENCTIKKCGDATLRVDKNTATLVLPSSLTEAGSSYTLEIKKGVSDREHIDTGRDYFFDIQFRSIFDFDSKEPVQFNNGVYILLAEVADPIPAVLTLISDFRVLENGHFAFVGAEGDEINGDPKNTRNPENLVVDETNQGYTVYVTGRVISKDGKRVMQSDPFDVIIPVASLKVEMNNVRLFAEIVKNPKTGKDQIKGTLSFEKVTIVNKKNRNEQPGGSTALIADFVPPNLVPNGTPNVCSNLCGAVTGHCEPPLNFPPSEICE